MTTARKGRLTFRITGVLFCLSALFELMAWNSPVPLFGAIREGAPALSYHLLYSGLLALAGVGLWRGLRLGYYAVIAGALIYTLDRGLLVLDQALLESYVAAQLAAHGEVAQIVAVGDVMALTTLASILFIAGWWGFVLYMRWRRAYFAPAPPADDSAGDANGGG